MAGELEGLHPEDNNQAKLVSQPSRLPTRKIGAGALGGAVVVLLAYVLQQFGIVIPGEVAAAATLIAQGGLAYIVKERAVV